REDPGPQNRIREKEWHLGPSHHREVSGQAFETVTLPRGETYLWISDFVFLFCSPAAIQTDSVPEKFPPDVPNPIDLVIKQEPEELGDDIVQIRVPSLPLKNENTEESNPPERAVEAIDLTTREEGRRKKPHACPICGKSYSWKSHLEIHLRVHTGEKPFGCSVCGKRFTKKMYLVIHLRRHTGEKPFSCSCGKAFTSRSHLEMHLHTGERPFSCPVCQKSFRQKNHVQKHINIHLRQLSQEQERHWESNLQQLYFVFHVLLKV
uniref:C2H2-type domain-containing protein n=1 Tax=Periophthalmus magnuspinnatus TaxID=409849 RepID=A0A3B3ZRL0_9GOBI